MKKVALIIYSITEFGGAERRLIRIYNELGKKMECDLIIRGCKSPQIFMQRLEKADCDVSNIHEIKYFKNNIQALMYLFFQGKYNIIHYIDLCGFHKIIARMCKKSSTNTILTIAFQDYAYGLINNRVKKQLISLINLSDKVDVLFPVGKKLFDEISSNKNITITPGTFTNLDLFVPDEKEKIILFAAARLEKDKNAQLLIEACKICQDKLRQNNYKVIICGQGYEESFLRELVDKYCISDVIDMPGYVKISEIIPKAEVFVCIDLIDNYPSQTIAEAVACGCSLICTDVGYSRMCGNEEFASFIKNDSQELANAIEVFVDKSDKEKKKIVNKAREYAVNNYSIKVSVDYFEKLME